MQITSGSRDAINALRPELDDGKLEINPWAWEHSTSRLGVQIKHTLGETTSQLKDILRSGIEFSDSEAYLGQSCHRRCSS